MRYRIDMSMQPNPMYAGAQRKPPPSPAARRLRAVGLWTLGLLALFVALISFIFGYLLIFIATFFNPDAATMALMLLFAPLLLVPAGVLLIDAGARQWRDLPMFTGYCPHCQYDLTNQIYHGCPECGWARDDD